MVSNYKRKTDKASYSREKLQAAVRAVRNGELSGYRASIDYNIPRMTIMDHVKNKRTKSNTLGRNTALPLQVETKLASCLHMMEKHGFGLTKTEMLEMVAEYVKRNKISTPFKNGIPGNSWFTAFKKRHHLSVKKPQAVEYARKKAMNPFIVYPYFELLEKTLTDLNLLKKPSSIWNLDETSFSKDPEKTKIVGLKGHAATRIISSPGKDNTTVLLGVNALGEKMPPLIIFKGKHMWDEWTSPEAYPGTTYAATKNGWMESEVFETYFKKVFIPNIGDDRPVLLTYDGHATHVGLNIIEEARKANITILKLPAHTSHVLQPLDVSVMKSFKDRWDQLLVKWQRLNVGVTLSKKEFAKLIGQVWTQIDSQILKNGFRKTGIYPFNPKAVEEKQFDSLKLEQWKHFQKQEPQKKLEQISQNSLNDCPNFDDKVEDSSTRSGLKTLLSLAFNCILNVAHTTCEELDSQQIPDSNGSPIINAHDPNKQNEIELENGDLLKHQEHEASEFTNNDFSNFKSDGKKIQVLEDKIVTFEELLLMKVKAGNNAKLKRHRIGPGAEVITHDDVLRRKMEENIKNIKTEPKEIKIKTQKRKILIEPGPSSFLKKPTSRERQQNPIKSKKGKGLGKKSCIHQTQQKKVTKSKKIKRPQVASDDSTSFSDCISVYGDSDICDSEHDFEEDVSATEEMEISKNYRSKSHTVKEIPEKVCSKLVEQNKEIDENCKFGTENHKNGDDSNNVTSQKDKLIQDYVITDIVLVRYLIRRKWTYYVGYVEEVKPGDDEIYYSITFYKTVKKPLKFIVTKKKDYDDVPSLYIVKKICLCQNPDNPKEFILSNDDDAIYFL